MSASALARWDWPRWLRLAIGAAFLMEGWHSGSGFAFAAGALFTMQGVLNIGCPMMGSCAAPRVPAPQDSNDITYNEIK